MKIEKIKVENLDCSGCAMVIKNNLLALKGIKRVDIDIQNNIVTVRTDDVQRDVIINKLKSIGYPEAQKEGSLL